MDSITQTEMYSKRDKILATIQANTAWFNTARKRPQEYDADMLGKVWAVDASYSVGVATAWQTVSENPDRYITWTHTPNVPLRDTKIWGVRK